MSISMPSRVQEQASRGIVPQWTLGDRLRKARELTGLTQVQFAEELGLSRATVNNSEMDKTTPRRPVIMLWAMGTGVPMEWLETGKVSGYEEAPDPDGPGAEGLPRLDSNQQPADLLFPVIEGGLSSRSSVTNDRYLKPAA